MALGEKSRDCFKSFRFILWGPRISVSTHPIVGETLSSNYKGQPHGPHGGTRGKARGSFTNIIWGTQHPDLFWNLSNIHWITSFCIIFNLNCYFIRTRFLHTTKHTVLYVDMIIIHCNMYFKKKNEIHTVSFCIAEGTELQKKTRRQLMGYIVFCRSK